MTKEELVKLIESKSNNGNIELSEDDLYEIGIAHRQLPKGDRSWSWLLSKTGGFVSGEAYRSFVLRRLREEGKIESPINLNNEESLVQKRQELYKARQQVRDEWSTYNRMMREDARIDTIKETMLDCANKLEPFHKMEYQGNGKCSTEAILMISDLHVGVEFDDFCNKYNLHIARERVSKLIDDTKRYCKLHGVQRLNIINLGDMIAGIIHTTIRLEQEFDVIDQIMNASEIVAGMLNELQDVAPEVIYRSCTDNHSRVIANKNEAIEKENFYRLMDWYVQERLKDSKIIFKNDNLSKEIGKFELLNGKKVMFAHGHNDSPNKIFQSYIGATEEYINYVLLGHYHVEKVKNFQNLRVFVNGSIVGTDDYAASKRLYTKPSQVLLVFDGDNVIHYSINLSIGK